MRRDADVCASVVREDVVEECLGADVLRSRCLACYAGPVGVGFGEALLKGVVRECAVDVCLVAASIAGVQGDTFTEELLNNRHERILAWQIKTGEGEVYGCQASLHRTGVVALRNGDLGDVNGLIPEGVRDECLLDSKLCDFWVCPVGSAVAIDERPVAVPGWGAVEGFGGVVVAFAVTAHD